MIKRLISICMLISLVTMNFVGLMIFEGIMDTWDVEAAIITVDDNGDGDYILIQSAINAASPGDTIYVWAGVYNETMAINKRITLIGNGSKASKVNGGSSGLTVYITADSVTIDGFWLLGGGASTFDATLRLYQAQSCVIKNNTIESSRSDGILLRESNYNTIKNNTIYSISWSGINLVKSSNNIINYNNVSNSKRGCTTQGSSNYNLIEKNNFSNNDEGIFNADATSYNKILNNTISSNSAKGIQLGTFTNNIMISDNNISNNGQEGIFIRWGDKTIVNNNTIISNNYDGIYITNSKGNKITNNNVSYNKKNGITIQTKSINGEVISNIVISNSGHGYSFGTDCDNNLISNNTSLLNKEDGFFFGYSINNEIANNIGVSNSKNGFNYYGLRGSTLQNNTAYSNKYSGFNLYTANGNTIKYNGFYNNLNNGISLLSSHYNNIIYNEINNNEFAGINFSNSNSNKVSNNSLTKNNQSGIYSKNSKLNILFNNEISNNSKGITFFGTNDCFVFNNGLITNNLGLNLNSTTRNNSIYHNIIILNSVQAIDLGSNYWNNSELEGNFWSDYTGFDNGANGRVLYDGIGDTLIPHLNLDNYPFTDKTGWIYPGIPILQDPGNIDTDGKYQISWNKTARVTGYILEEDLSDTFGSPIIVYNGTNINVNINKYINDTFYYRIKSYNDNFESRWSNIVDINVDFSPSSPMNLKTQNPTGHEVDLSWDPNPEPDLNGYHIFVNDTNKGPSGPYHLVSTVTKSISQYTISNLAEETTYYFVIVAFDNVLTNSTYSNIASATTLDVTPPLTPFSFKAKPLNNKEIELTWNPNLDFDLNGYYIYMNNTNEDQNGEFHLIATPNKDSTSYIVTGLAEQSTYHFKIVAFDEVPNNSSYSEVSSATTPDQTPPEPPSGLIANPMSESRIALDWDANPEADLTGYLIYINETNNGPSGKFYVVHTILNSSTSYSVIGLAEKVAYYFKIKAFDEVPNNSTFSNFVSATTLDVTPPAAPVGLEVINPTIDSLTVTWNANTETDLEGYFLFRSLSSESSFEKINLISITDTTFIDENLDEYVTYYYKLIAMDEIGLESSFSEIVSGKTLLGPYSPHINNSIDDFNIAEDSYDDKSINLYYWFKDINDDTLSFRCEGQNQIKVTIHQANGTVVFQPKQNWNGKETLTFFASDNNVEISDDVIITVTPVNDPPGPAEIINPSDGIEIVEGDKLNLEAKCSDPDLSYGDILTYKWILNIAEELGTGEKLEEITLQNGKHIITITVTDLKGESTTDSIIIIVKSKDGTPLMVETDNDKDGMPDIWESENELDPFDPTDAGKDGDSDGLSNLQEFQHSTDPNNPDSDNDGIPDGFEINTFKTNATNPDTDSDGHNDGEDSSPLDSTKWEKKSSDPDKKSNWGIIAGALIIIIVIVILLFLFIIKPKIGRKVDKEKQEEPTDVPSDPENIQKTPQQPQYPQIPEQNDQQQQMDSSQQYPDQNQKIENQ